MNDESRPSGTASEIPAKKSGYILRPPTDETPLFDVVSDGGTTSYRPSVEMDRALGSDDFWAATARSAIKALAETMSTFTADDLHEVGLPEPINKNCYGAALSAAANSGLIEIAGYRKSRRREARSRVVSVWRGAR
jgi:hypothetical protein